MRLNSVILKLQKIQKEVRKKNKKSNPDVVVDFDDNGYFNVEEIVREADDDGETVINIISSSEM